MNKYIGTVSNGYMFTNRLSGISKDDILYNYDKKGKFIRCEDNNIIGQATYKSQGTGRITQKHRVVEVYEVRDDCCIRHPNIGMGSIELDLHTDKFYDMGIGYTNQSYTIKLEKIEDVDMELSDFLRYSYAKENYNFVFKAGFRKDTFEDYIKQISKPIVRNTSFKLTKYTGLQKVISIGGM